MLGWPVALVIVVLGFFVYLGILNNNNHQAQLRHDKLNQQISQTCKSYPDPNRCVSLIVTGKP